MSYAAMSRQWRYFVEVSERRAFLAAAIYVSLYVAVDWLCYVRPQLGPGITPWNPQAGITLAFLVVYGSRWFLATAIAASLAAVLVRAAPAAGITVYTTSIWIALVYALLAVVVRRARLAVPIESAAAAARFAGASVAGTLLVAIGYVGSYIGVGEIPVGDALRGIARYWLADLNGVLMLTPLLLQTGALGRALQHARRAGWEIPAQGAVILATLWVIFTLPVAEQLRFFYLLFVPVIWVALRWSWPGALLAVLAIQVGLIVAAEADIHTPRFIDLQFLMLTLALTALLLGAVVRERAGVLRRVAAREAEQRALLAMAPDAVLTVDAGGAIKMANPAAVRLFGRDCGEAQRVRLTQLLPEINLSSAAGRAALDGRREDRSEFPAEVAWARLDTPTSEGFLVTVRDVTERRRSEEQLRERDAALSRAMRFAMAGELASSLAHELNQPITALVSYLNASEILANRAQAVDDRLQSTLGKAGREAMRASEVLHRLRNFYRGGASKREIVNLRALAGVVVAAFQERLRRAGATLVVSAPAMLPEFEGDAMQLEIVLHNLLANAIDAVTRVDATHRRIELSAAHSEGVVTLQVDDTGAGIAPQVAGQLFEPFVTSKSDGMGLGLAISRTLIRARGGELSFTRSSRLGGACFIVRIPVVVPVEPKFA